MNQNVKQGLAWCIGLRISVRFNAVLIVSLLGASLVGCGSTRSVDTGDNSVDYKSARALPPLKKPSNTPLPDSPAPAVADATEPDLPQQAAVSQPMTTTSENLTASVVSSGGGESRLTINGEFEQAWAYLNRNLQQSDVTVFSRNKEAGRFAIGCAGVAEDSVKVERRGGWSFFIRGKPEALEYCALQVRAKRADTEVLVLDRTGVEVSAENAASVFNRILNN